MAKKSIEIRTRTLLEQLSRDEMKHKVALLALLDKNSLGFEAQNIKNIDIIVDNVEPNFELSPLSTLSTIIQFAITKEIESNNLYINLAENINDHKIHQTLLFLAKEEKKHKEVLEMELKFYNESIA
jgi:rubrerythrin